MPRKRLLTRRKLVKNQKLLTVLIVTFCEGNGLAEVEENDSNDSPVYEDDAHKTVLCTKSFFFRRLLVIMTSMRTKWWSMRVVKISVIIVINDS